MSGCATARSRVKAIHQSSSRRTPTSAARRAPWSIDFNAGCLAAGIRRRADAASICVGPCAAACTRAAKRWCHGGARVSGAAPRFVVIVDGSRSMGADGLAALRVTTALASATRNLEAFTFSTELRRITPDVRRVSAGERRRLAFLHHAWGGGTSLGTCLQEFLRRHGDRLIDGDTVVMIASDGLDVGDPLVLRDAMARLHRRSAGIVWLNPLTQTDGYEPTAAGMYIARPFVDGAGLGRRCGGTAEAVANDSVASVAGC